MSSSPTPKASIHRVHGKALWEALGFRSERSFQRARQAGTIKLKLYPLASPARGVYARSDDLERHLATLEGKPIGSREGAA